jgi:hypothetical protein
MYMKHKNGIKNRTAVLMAVILSGSLLWSCSDSKSSNKEDNISEEVGMEILTQLMSQAMMLGFGVIDKVDETGTFRDQHIKNLDIVAETISVTIPCSEGGSMAVNGTFTDNISDEGTGSASFDIRNNPNDCGLATSEGVYKVNGNPDLRTTFAMNYSDWEPVGNFTFSFTGGYVWSGAGGTGSCNLNVSYTFNFDNPGMINMTGNMCGYTY